MFNEVFDAFIDESPISVMYRGTLENIFAARKLDDIFSGNAVSQVNGKLAFSTCAGLLSLLTTRIQPSVNAAYGKKVKEIAVSVNAVYDKLKGIELSVSQALVSRTAADLSELVRQMGALQEGPLPGYDLRCELNTPGFPKAALFSFCVAVVMYNALSAVVAALRVAHPEVPTGSQRKSGADRTFSIYYIADEISGVSRGMSIAIGEEYWACEFATLTIKQLGRRLIWLAKRVKIRQYLTHPYGAKGPKAKSRRSGKKHVSTFRELEKHKKLRESG